MHVSPLKCLGEWMVSSYCTSLKTQVQPTLRKPYPSSIALDPLTLVATTTPTNSMSVPNRLTADAEGPRTSAGASMSAVEEVMQHVSSPASPVIDTPTVERNDKSSIAFRNIVEPAVIEDHGAQALKQ